MRYEGSVYRPPSEAYSLILQVTIGCAHNDCTFCSMFKDKAFRVRKLAEILEDLESARRAYRNVVRIFLADGDALVMPEDELTHILKRIGELFPECGRVGVYGSPQDVLRKGTDAMARLGNEGLGIVYIGAESGCDETLRRVKKGATSAQIEEAIGIIEGAGIPSSVTIISGLAGTDGWEKHAKASGELIGRTCPSYASLLTLMVDPAAPIYRDIQDGRFTLPSPDCIVDETIMLLESVNISKRKKCVFRSNHASNYLSLKGDLPEDKDRMIAQLAAARENSAMLKDERFRML